MLRPCGARRPWHAPPSPTCPASLRRPLHPPRPPPQPPSSLRPLSFVAVRFPVGHTALKSRTPYKVRPPGGSGRGRRSHAPQTNTAPLPSPASFWPGLELPPGPEGGQNQTPRWIRTGFFLTTGRVGTKVASPGAQHGLVASCGSMWTSTGQWAEVRGEMTPVPGDISTDVRGQGPGTAAATAGVAGKCLLFGASSKQLSAQGKRREPERRPRCQGVRPPGHGFSALEPESAQVREGRQPRSRKPGPASQGVQLLRRGFLIVTQSRTWGTRKARPKLLCISKVLSSSTMFRSWQNKTILQLKKL